jgi:Zinc finger, C2H2 type
MNYESMVPNPAWTTAPQDPPLRCEDCDKVFTARSKYNRHRDTHTRPYKCHGDGCQLVAFATRKDLERHQRSRHVPMSKVKEYSCRVPKCPFNREEGGRGFGRKDNLLRHMRRAHSGKDDADGQAQHAPDSRDRDSDMEMGDEVDALAGREINLLDKGVEVSEGGEYSLALQAASLQGHEPTVKQLQTVHGHIGINL